MSPSKEKVIKLSKKPHEILQDPLLNKGTAFSQSERDSLGLNGFLPCWISTLDEQLERNFKNFMKKRTPLGKYVFLADFMNRNEILFYIFAEKYISEVMPIIYTPTVGEASLQYSMIYKQRRGIYLSYPLRHKMDEIIANIPNQDVSVAVVTDGERILGLGDQGIGGMAIPIGKLALYTLFAGIHPSRTLPILLDVGTNNPDLLKNPLYLGWRHERIAGDAYYEFVDHFVQAIKKRYPHLLLQWEDFGKQHARKLLTSYKDKILSFNDDIQGTAAVVLGAMYAASKRAGVPFKNHKFVVVGGGSAGIGVAEVLSEALILEGLSPEEALARLYIIDVHGLIHSHQLKLEEEHKKYARPNQELRDWKITSLENISLQDVVRNAHPTAIVGVCGQAGIFTEELVREMATHVKRPIIFPLSNPTSKAEAFPDEILRWSEGKAVVATGSPFMPVEYGGKKYHIAQCNNAYIFPGVGLGALAAQAKKITDGMFWESAKTFASLSPKPEDESASLFPEMTNLRAVSRKVAIAVAKRAVQEGVAPSISLQEIEQKVDAMMWHPHYDTYERG